MRAERQQGERLVDELGGRVRDDDLPAVTCRSNACRVVNVCAHVTLLGHQW